ncbi:thiamine biosynthesis protein ThiS [Aureimonas sp. SA4125]|uniref:sulfur carrier protein ThiS n=1 Tax=Aureimonas sp. SA4125 TaxID=2826993 RepID=UPI001CC738CF|nr:sulfur carrier protein ThiS [Aureimonas sp. SA4125]BDA85279.1 thiamine biosynthesis protein ThiS [Aureimonas sp. SA4125]
MRITVNGESRELSAGTLDEAMLELGLAGAVVGTAVNREFVPACDRPGTRLLDGDAVEILAPMQGG